MKKNYQICLTGIMISVGSLASLVGYIVAKQVLIFVGELNIIYIAIIVDCLRLVIWAFVK